MSDDSIMSYSYQVEPEPRVASADVKAGLVAFTNCDLISLNDRGTLLLDRNRGNRLIVANEVATALTYCGTFKTIAEHAEYLTQTIPQLENQLNDVKNVLNMVREGGLMLEASDIVERLRAEYSEASTPSPTRVCIITCDRPQAVERLLDSILRAGELSQHNAMFLIDDSRDEANAEQNRELVTRFNLTSARTISYLGPRELEAFMTALIEKCPEDERAIRFLVDRERWVATKSYGLARNFSLLLTVGYRCIVLDDDILCAAVEAPTKKEGVSFGDGNSRELACFESEQELMQSAHVSTENLLTGHARCLGLPLSEALARLGASEITEDSLKDVNAAFLNTLRCDSPILLTQCGSWGDPGTTGSNWLSHLGPESIERALNTPEGLNGTFKNRHYWLGRSQPNIGKMGIMSQATGLDNSCLLPPYFPVLRSEDYLFAAMLVFLHPSSAVLDYAWSVPHLHVSDSSGSDDAAITAGASLSMCARYIVDHTELNGGVSVETRLASLSTMVAELGEMSVDEFVASFEKTVSETRAEQLALLSRQAKVAPAFGSPDWEDYLRQGIEEVSQSLQTPAQIPRVSELNSDADDEKAAGQIQLLVKDFAAAIGAWPGIREAAAEISIAMIE